MPRKKQIKKSAAGRRKQTRKSSAPNKAEQANEILKCGTDVSYFLSRYVKIFHPTKGLIKFDTYPFQDDCLKAFQKNRFVIVNKSRQLGLSTSAAGYSLWMALFQQGKQILVVATKLDVAKNFIKKVRDMYDYLPKWLIMPEVTSESKNYLGFSNGSMIKASTTSGDAGRSEALSLLLVDECTSHDTYITIRNKVTGEIRVEKIGNLFSSKEYK